MSDRAFGNTGPTGAHAWSQTAGFAAVGAQIELLPIIAAPVIAASFSPATILTGGTSTLTFSLTSPTAIQLTNANFTDTFNNMFVAATTIWSTNGSDCRTRSAKVVKLITLKII